MKYILMILFFTLSAGAKTITEDGVTYNCNPEKSCEEKLAEANKEIARLKKRLESRKKKVVSQKPAIQTVITEVKTVEKVVVQIQKVEPPKNILSGYIVRSQDGLDTDTNPASTKVETKYDLGVGIMYQRRVSEKIYLGAGVDTNSGTKLSVGLGF